MDKRYLSGQDALNRQHELLEQIARKSYLNIPTDYEKNEIARIKRNFEQGQRIEANKQMRQGRYKKTSTGAIADADFSAKIEEKRKQDKKEYKDYLSGKGPNPFKKTEGGKQKRMTKKHTTNKKQGGSVCARPTGKGFGKARKR